MWRDSWFVIGAVLACLPCLTPVAVVLLIYRHRLACRRAP